ncbi:MAG TPA: hypothetical protein VMI54_23250 [Polyangiaceae bacterium]|nr:hypothetical protein [Polyangiaceae bacterium]
MNDRPEVYKAIEDMLVKTRAEELDCDAFLELLAPYVDQRLADPALVGLIERHRDLCRECAEELDLLETALAAK